MPKKIPKNYRFTDSFIDRLFSSRLNELSRLAKSFIFGSRINPEAYDKRILDDIDISRLQDIAYQVRGSNYRPIIIVHGVMPRSGTNYVSDLIKLHKDINYKSHSLWEFPFLYNIRSVNTAQQDFLRSYKRNAEVLRPFEFAAYLISGFLKSLQHAAGDNKTVLLKVPHSEYLYLFHALLPNDHLVLVMRDGRDAIASYQKTFGTGILKRSFTELCQKWSHSTLLALSYAQGRVRSPGKMENFKYEDIKSDPNKISGILADSFDLPLSRYDSEKTLTIPVRGSSLQTAKQGIDWQPREAPPDFDSMLRWDDWSLLKKYRFKRIAGDALISAGYANNSTW